MDLGKNQDTLAQNTDNNENEFSGQFGIVIATDGKTIIIIDSGSLDNLNYDAAMYESLASGMTMKIIPYEQATYNEIKGNPYEIQSRLQQFFI